ncbi:MAG: hypothetical protein M3143_10285 [Actinomycetota bacterium]|nr:hypothetical protein [Actinomycetota bacterium]
MSQTPIYDQLRGERINADVPATGADPQPVGHPGQHRLSADELGPMAAFARSPGPGPNLTVNHSGLSRTNNTKTTDELSPLNS